MTNSTTTFCAEKQKLSEASDLASCSLGYLTLALLDALLKNFTVTEVHILVHDTAHFHARFCADFLAH